MGKRITPSERAYKHYLKHAKLESGALLVTENAFMASWELCKQHIGHQLQLKIAAKISEILDNPDADPRAAKGWSDALQEVTSIFEDME